jgi:undecaprenyl-diphosphatase
MLVVGGVFMLFCDKIFNQGSEAHEGDMEARTENWFLPCISVIPA